MLDVADVLIDPDLAQAVLVTRATEDVDERGRTQQLKHDFTVQGVVHPATEKQLLLLPEASRGDETIAVYTVTKLTAGDDAHSSDTVTWQGETYKVVKVMDYSDYGYILALAASDTMQGRAVE
jgi:hypothetical protein